MSNFGCIYIIIYVESKFHKFCFMYIYVYLTNVSNEYEMKNKITVTKTFFLYIIYDLKKYYFYQYNHKIL